MLRTALKPKWLGLLGLVVVIVVAFIQLGRWQLGVAKDQALEDQLARAKAQGTVALADVLKPHQAFPGELSGRPVTATGRYAVDEQVVIVDRRLAGVAGYWVVTALHTEGGATLPVLRGFVTDPAEATAPPTGAITVSGGLAPGESPLRDAGRAPLPEGQMRSVDLAVLVNEWSGEFYNAFVFLDREQPATGVAGAEPADAGALNGLTHVPTPTGEIGFQWRNGAYAAQWWVFALFAVWMWWRMVRDDHRKSRAAVGTSPDEPADLTDPADLAGPADPADPAAEGGDATRPHGIPAAGRE